MGNIFACRELSREKLYLQLFPHSAPCVRLSSHTALHRRNFHSFYLDNLKFINKYLYLVHQIGIYRTKLAIRPAMPTNEQAIPPIRVCTLYNSEGSLEALDFQLSVMLYTTSGKHNINTPTINKKILPKIIIQSHSFVKFKFVYMFIITYT